MKYLRRFNESINEVEIVNFLDDIFLELTDVNSNISVNIDPNYNSASKTKIVGFEIRISSTTNIRLSDIYDTILVCMDYMRSNNMTLISFNSIDISNTHRDINYFYDYMSGNMVERVENDISSKLFSIRFKY